LLTVAGLTLEENVLKGLGVILICISALASFGQTSSAKYEPGTITDVVTHQNVPGKAGEEATRYDVSLKIRNVVYVVLYTPRTGDNTVEYSRGMEMLFLVGTDTVTFNGRAGELKMPILRREVLPAQEGIDWSKAPSQYFTMKQQHLSDALNLSEDQQAKIKPLIQQEAGEAGMILWTPVVPAKERLKQYEKIVSASDVKIKAFLSPAQVDKLVELRKEQKAELKKLIAEREPDKQD
jgi:hypothetical protein